MQVFLADVHRTLNGLSRCVNAIEQSRPWVAYMHFKVRMNMRFIDHIDILSSSYIATTNFQEIIPVSFSL